MFFRIKLNVPRTLFFLALGPNITAFFIFLYPKTYPKVLADSVIQTPDPLLVSLVHALIIEDSKFENKFHCPTVPTVKKLCYCD